MNYCLPWFGHLGNEDVCCKMAQAKPIIDVELEKEGDEIKVQLMDDNLLD